MELRYFLTGEFIGKDGELDRLLASFPKSLMHPSSLNAIVKVSLRSALGLGILAPLHQWGEL